VLALIVIGLCYGAYRLGVRRHRPDPAASAAAHGQVAPPVAALLESPACGELRSLSSWAFDYERMLLEQDATPAQRERVLYALTHLIRPLIGQARLGDVNDDLARAVELVLGAQLPADEARYVARLWVHFICWTRQEAASSTEDARLPF
jgi:hypothetical protein